MDIETKFLVFGLFLVAVWLIPAVIYTEKIIRTDELAAFRKRRLLVYLWCAPLIGSFICLILFSNTGQLRRLSEAEHRSFWYFW